MILPTLPAGCVIDLDSSDIDQITQVDGRVASWRSKQGELFSQPTPAIRPYVESFDGKTWIRFKGSGYNAFLRGATNRALPEHTVIAVSKFDQAALGATPRKILWVAVGTLTLSVQTSASTTQWNMTDSPGGGGLTSFAPTALPTITSWVNRAGAGQAKFRVTTEQGTQIHSRTAGIGWDASQAFMVGYSSDSFLGLVSRFLVFNRRLSDEEIELVETRLIMERWLGYVGIPPIRLEVGFGAGISTPTSEIPWTDLTGSMRLDKEVKYSLGSTDPRDGIQAGTATLTLENQDGRFTPKNPASPHYPNCELQTPIRLGVVLGGTTDWFWFGYASKWEPDVENGSRGFINIEALDKAGGTATPVAKGWECDAILATKPTDLWMLGDADLEDGAHNEVPGRSSLVFVDVLGQPIEHSITVGVGKLPMEDGTVAAVELVSGTPATEKQNSDMTWSAAAVLLAGGTPPASKALIFQSGVAGLWGFSIYVTPTGVTLDTPLGERSLSVNVFDGKWHSIGVDRAVNNVRLWVDGVPTSAVSVVTGTAGTPQICVPGTSDGGQYGNDGVGSQAAGFACQIAGYTKWGGAITNQLERHYGAISVPVEPVANRILRLAQIYGIDADVPLIGDPGVNVEAEPISGQDVIEVLEATAASGLGDIFFDGPTLTYRNLSDRYNRSTKLRLGPQDVSDDLTANYDTDSIINNAKVSIADGREFTATEPDSTARFGATGDHLETLGSSPDVARVQAYALAYRQAWPEYEVASLTIDAWTKRSTVDFESTVLLTVGDVVEVDNLPVFVAPYPIALSVNGVEGQISDTDWSLTFKTSPAAWFEAGVVAGASDDATSAPRSVLDSTARCVL